MESPWNEQDVQDFSSRGWKLDEVERQKIQLEKSGVHSDVLAPCVAGDGIFVLNANEKRTAKTAFSELLASSKTLARFVPASGVASRMFAPVRGNLSEEVVHVLADKGQRLPMLQAENYSDMKPGVRALTMARDLLAPDPGWSNWPKGLIPFHRYANGDTRTPFEEHAHEWHALAPGERLHFTVPFPFRASILNLIRSKGFDGAELSVQASQTDTLALNIESNQLVRDAHGKLLFRPGGHGALLHNLNLISDDFVFIRNIDNVVPQHRMPGRNEVQTWMGGEAYRLTQERNALVHSLRIGSRQAIENARVWLGDFHNDLRERTADQLLEALNRPIRVAGMVPNEGQPGGGPFWLRLQSGNVVPAIVEGDEMKESMLRKGTHFNPVDICCSLTDPDGASYDLIQFASRDLFFTAMKDWEGQSIRILERPGLWNGAMASWLTRFIEVPSDTFAPVKSVLDLMDESRLK